MRDSSERDWAEQFLHGRDGVRLLPYAKVDGQWTLPDEDVCAWWFLLKRDRTVGRVFPDAEVASMGEWVMHCQRNLLIAFSDGRQYLGVAWLNNIKPESAMAHYAFFRESWGTHVRTMMRLGLDYWFAMPGDDKGRRLQTIVGMTPTHNRLAIRQLHELGFHILGDIPHMCSRGAVTLSYLTRDAHYGRKEQRRAGPAGGVRERIASDGAPSQPAGHPRSTAVH